MTAETFLTQDELARRWKLSVYTLAAWRRDGKGPPFMKVAGRKSGIRYSVADIIEFEKEATEGGANENE